VVPVYNEQDSLAVLVGEIATALQDARRSYELVVVDDGSTDESLARLKALKARHSELHIVVFAAHAGQTAALAASSSRWTRTSKTTPPRFRRWSTRSTPRVRAPWWVIESTGGIRSGGGCRVGSPMVSETGLPASQSATPGAR
jgi:cellulose synthase/poly-beta-1,6-N-acetylglucosamine synthase-like glycosyltransferase